MYMILNDFGVPNFAIFAVLMPFALIYAYNFIELHKLRENEPQHFEDSFESNLENETPRDEILGQEEELLSDYKDQSLSEAYMIDPWNHVLIFLLYFFEYIVITSFFDRIAQLRGSFESDIFLERNLFTVSQFLYQFGVLIARSSLY
mmetsp:Transcript_12624/g.14202  ORF Transcript_12624/g.14202 Transcript_12624/m.14202 type:complete len:147 (+) Transcript_12624:49-489(+)